MIQKYFLKKVDLELILEMTKQKTLIPVAPVQDSLDIRRVKPSEKEKNQIENQGFTNTKLGPFRDHHICFEKLCQVMGSLKKPKK